MRNPKETVEVRIKRAYEAPSVREGRAFSSIASGRGGCGRPTPRATCG